MSGRFRARADPDWPGGVPCLELDPDDSACARRSPAASRDAWQGEQGRCAQHLGHGHEQPPLAFRVGGAHDDCLVYPEELRHLSAATAMANRFA